MPSRNGKQVDDPELTKHVFEPLRLCLFRRICAHFAVNERLRAENADRHRWNEQSSLQREFLALVEERRPQVRDDSINPLRADSMNRSR